MTYIASNGCFFGNNKNDLADKAGNIMADSNPELENVRQVLSQLRRLLAGAEQFFKTSLSKAAAEAARKQIKNVDTVAEKALSPGYNNQPAETVVTADNASKEVPHNRTFKPS